MVNLPETIPSIFFNPFTVAILVLIITFILGQIIKRIIISVSSSTGIDEIARGTSFERLANSFGSSTVGVFAGTMAWLVYLSGIIASLEILNIGFQGSLEKVAGYIPNLIVAVLILVFGAVAADRISILISERLKKIRISGTSFISKIAKYSILFIALLMALSQLGVSTVSLYILLFSYLLAIIVFCTIAFRTALSSIVGGLYILTTQPYSVGDNIRFGNKEGIVQEISIFTTRIENEKREYVVPNDTIFKEGVSKKLKY